MTSTPMRGRILICAGSDSGGGAGLQADLKTVTALGGYAMTAVTALTAQNTQGIFAIHPVPPPFIVQQIIVCLEDIGADVVKTGMLATVAVIEAVAATLTTMAPAVPLVVDPVMVAKDGTALLAADGVQALVSRLMVRATLITPNLPEAKTLLGGEVLFSTPASVTMAARRLLEMAPAVLVKGGHQRGKMVTDVLATRSGTLSLFTQTRIESPSTHGTGCTLAAAVACGLAQGMALEAAVERAHAYVHTAIATAPGFGHGYGPLNHAHTVRSGVKP